jgi:chromosome segregation ATPase
MPALKIEPESFVEERVAVLEANIEYIRSDISDMKTEMRRLNDKIDAVDQKLTGKIESVDQKLSARIESLDQKLSARIEGLDQKFTAKIKALDQKFTEKCDAVRDGLATLTLSMEKSFSELKVGRAIDRVWWLLNSAALLGIMARAFKWI